MLMFWATVALFFVGSAWCDNATTMSPATSMSPATTVSPNTKKCQEKFPDASQLYPSVSMTGCDYICSGRNAGGGMFVETFNLAEKESCGDDKICMGNICTKNADIKMCNDNAKGPITTIVSSSCVITCSRNTTDGNTVLATILQKPKGTDCSLGRWKRACDDKGACRSTDTRRRRRRHV